MQGLAAADIKVTFNSAVLSARGAHTGSLTPGWSLTPNTATAGEIRLAMASPGGTVTGAGTLALLEFEVVGAAGSSSPLTLASASLNAGAIPVDLANGSFAVATAYSVAGTVRFWQDSSPVPGVQLTLAGATALHGPQRCERRLQHHRGPGRRLCAHAGQGGRRARHHGLRRIAGPATRRGPRSP